VFHLVTPYLVDFNTININTSVSLSFCIYYLLHYKMPFGRFIYAAFERTNNWAVQRSRPVRGHKRTSP